MLDSYKALCTRVDRFAAATFARYKDHILCGPSCADCCQAGLTLVLVEAVSLGSAFDIQPERIHLQAGLPPHFTEGRCALLGPNGLCTAYELRPLICRTHGLPLIYPDNRELTYCAKNFVSETPHRSAAMQMVAVETALFAANLDYCRKAGLNPMARVAIDRIASLIGV